MKKLIHTNIRTQLLLALILFGSAAYAQALFDGAEVTGNIHGTLGETELTWNTYELPVPDGTQSTATYTVFMETIHSYTLQGHADGNLVEGALSIAFNTFGGPLADCPCQLSGEINYWTTSSMFNKLYVAGDAVIAVLEAELLPDGAYRLAGTAEADLIYYENLFSPEASGDPVPIQLEFSIDRVTPEEFDLD